MALRHRPFTEADAKEVADWQYEPPYDIYNFGGWEKALAGGSGLTRPEIRAQEFYALEEDGLFAGFFRFMELDPGDHGMLSLGLRPALCGRGRRKGSMALTKEGGPPAVLTSPFGWRSAHLTSVPESSMKPPGFMLSGSMNVPPPPGRLNFF